LFFFAIWFKRSCNTRQKLKIEPTYISGLKVKNRPFGSKRHGRSSDLFIFVEKILPFSYSKKSQETRSRAFFCKISPHFNEENYEMAKVLRGFGQMIL
jgi:hypothetical protein